MERLTQDEIDELLGTLHEKPVHHKVQKEDLQHGQAMYIAPKNPTIREIVLPRPRRDIHLNYICRNCHTTCTKITLFLAHNIRKYGIYCPQCEETWLTPKA